MFGDIFLIEREGDEPVRGERLAFGEISGRNESWLRDKLFDHPKLFPVKDIDPAYGPLTPLCKELRTEARPLDIAFINPFGRLTLVECKLWRKPLARREVVAQVLDYARAISRWSYSDLQRRVSAASGQAGNSPLELVKSGLRVRRDHPAAGRLRRREARLSNEDQRRRHQRKRRLDAVGTDSLHHRPFLR